MDRKIRMIGLDLDGTVLNERKEVTPRTKEALQKAVDQGVVVLFATGMPWTGIPGELQEFPGTRYALTSNGAKIIETKSQKVLIEHLLPVKKAKRALEIMRKYDTLQEVYLDGQGYIAEKHLEMISRYHRNPAMWEYVRTTRKKVRDVLEFMEEQNHPVDKIQGLFADMDERETAWRELEQVEGIALVGSLGYNIEINCAGVNKGKGLVELGKLLGISRDEIMACGDGDNDTEMVREAGFGVAMANAEEQVKAAADYITGTNEEDGVTQAIENFVL